MDLPTIKSLVEDDIKAVDELITARLSSDVVLINQLAGYIIHSGGKRLRPLVVLLAARACGYNGQAHINLAAVIEFIHTATLLHDDVVDHSDKRRGRDTANHIWGNEASVLVGDFLYSRAFEMMVEADRMSVMRLMAGTTNTIAAGEVLQLLNCHDPDVTEANYREVIYRKTATLFEAGCKLGAMITDQTEVIVAALGEYGLRLGNAFQLVDDVLDYDGDPEEIGKNIGDDLAEGKPTMPLIEAMRQANPEDTALLRSVIEEGGIERIDQVRAIVEKTGAVEYTRRLAAQEAEAGAKALDPLPDSDFKQALTALIHLSVARSS